MATYYLLKKTPPRPQAGPTVWLISFTDVMALMLTFFVLIFSMSEPIQNEIVEDISVMEKSASVTQGAPDFAGQAEAADWIRENRQAGLDLTYLRTLLSDMLSRLIQEEPKLSGIRLMKADNKLFIRIPDRVLRHHDAMVPLAMMLGRLNNDLAIWSPISSKRQDYVRALRRGVDLKDSLSEGGYDRPILLTTFSPFYSKGLSADLHIAIMETKAVSP